MTRHESVLAAVLLTSVLGCANNPSSPSSPSTTTTIEVITETFVVSDDFVCCVSLNAGPEDRGPLFGFDHSGDPTVTVFSLGLSSEIWEVIDPACPQIDAGPVRVYAISPAQREALVYEGTIPIQRYPTGSTGPGFPIPRITVVQPHPIDAFVGEPMNGEWTMRMVTEPAVVPSNCLEPAGFVRPFGEIIYEYERVTTAG